jgi:hypothetical protein
VYQALKTVVNVALVTILKLPGFEPRIWQKRVDGPFHKELTRMIVNCYNCDFLSQTPVEWSASVILGDVRLVVPHCAIIY